MRYNVDQKTDFKRRWVHLREDIESLEHDFSLIENGFKVEEKRALDDYKAHDREYIKELALLAYKSEVY